MDFPRFPAGIRTHRGSCRCGAIRFEIDVDLSEGTTQCNCTWCTKTGWWGLRVRPDAFRVEGAERRTYGPYEGDRTRCETCGVLTHGEGNIPELGGSFCSVNVRCLDEVDLHGVPIRYLDGRSDTWDMIALRRHDDPFHALRGA